MDKSCNTNTSRTKCIKIPLVGGSTEGFSEDSVREASGIASRNAQKASSRTPSENPAFLNELIDLARKQKKILCTAESCTGGLVGATLTQVPGVSEVYCGSVVSYANNIKRRVLGVRAETLKSVGAVSAECAAQMACGVLRLMEADLAVSITGIAGPGGGSPTKPLGTVYFGLACKKESSNSKLLESLKSQHTGELFVEDDEILVITERMHFSGDRDSVRVQSTAKAVSLFGEALGL